MVTVHAPASSGNLGAGFDALSMALDLCNEFSAEPADELLIENIGEGAAQLPTGPEHLVYRAIQRVYAATGGVAPPLRLRCVNRIPLSRGLGSSSSAIAGGLVIGNRLLGDPLNMDKLLTLATELEGHPDNVVACLLGGVQVSVQSGGRVLHCGVPINLPLTAVLFIPTFTMDTRQARHLLPSQVPLADAVFNLGRAALMVAALATGRADLLRTAAEDRLHQPPRTALFPALPAMLDAALQAGALAAWLSGAGSTILALSNGAVEPIGAALQHCAARHEIAGETRVVAIRERGAEIIES